MSAFYNNLNATASSLLNRFGQSVTFSRSVVGTYDPATGSASTTVSTFTADAAGFDYDNSEVDDRSILSSDLKLLIAATGYVPKINDLLTWNGVNYTVVMVAPLQPSSVAVIYECQIRRGSDGIR